MVAQSFSACDIRTFRCSEVARIGRTITGILRVFQGAIFAFQRLGRRGMFSNGRAGGGAITRAITGLSGRSICGPIVVVIIDSILRRRLGLEFLLGEIT